MNVWHFYTIVWTAFAVVWLIGALRTKETQERAPLASRVAYGIPVALGAYLMFSDNLPWAPLYTRVIPKSMVVDALGIFLTTAGIAFAIWARFYIGQNWSGTVTVKVGHALIQAGPYRWVRHPIYSGILLALFGTAVAHREVNGLVAVALFLLGFLIKSRLEEQMMRKTFGDEYVEYSRSTGALVPKLRG